MSVYAKEKSSKRNDPSFPFEENLNVAFCAFSFFLLDQSVPCYFFLWEFYLRYDVCFVLLQRIRNYVVRQFYYWKSWTWYDVFYFTDDITMITNMKKPKLQFNSEVSAKSKNRSTQTTSKDFIASQSFSTSHHRCGCVRENGCRSHCYQKRSKCKKSKRKKNYWTSTITNCESASLWILHTCGVQILILFFCFVLG